MTEEDDELRHGWAASRCKNGYRPKNGGRTKKPSRRQRKQLTPYQRQCLAIQLRGLRAEKFAAKREPQE